MTFLSLEADNRYLRLFLNRSIGCMKAILFTIPATLQAALQLKLPLIKKLLVLVFYSIFKLKFHQKKWLYFAGHNLRMHSNRYASIFAANNFRPAIGCTEAHPSCIQISICMVVCRLTFTRIRANLRRLLARPSGSRRHKVWMDIRRTDGHLSDGQTSVGRTDIFDLIEKK